MKKILSVDANLINSKIIEQDITVYFNSIDESFEFFVAQNPQETLDILKEEGADQVGGVLHCFTESIEMAEEAMKMGFYISVSGIVTFKNAKELKEVIKAVPLDRLLVETDSPYLAPVPHRAHALVPF